MFTSKSDNSNLFTNNKLSLAANKLLTSIIKYLITGYKLLAINKLAIILIASVFNVKCVKLQQTNSKQQNIL